MRMDILFWGRVEVAVRDVLPEGDLLRIRFITADTGGDAAVEAVVDDVRVTGVPSGDGQPGDLPGLLLVGPIPNPFSASMEIRFRLEDPGPVTVDLFDGQGRLVTRLSDGPRSSGFHVVPWDGLTDGGAVAPNGVYFMRVVSDDGAQVRKVVRTR